MEKAQYPVNQAVILRIKDLDHHRANAHANHQARQVIDDAKKVIAWKFLLQDQRHNQPAGYINNRRNDDVEEHMPERLPEIGILGKQFLIILPAYPLRTAK